MFILEALQVENLLLRRFPTKFCLTPINNSHYPTMVRALRMSCGIDSVVSYISHTTHWSTMDSASYQWAPTDRPPPPTLLHSVWFSCNLLTIRELQIELIRRYVYLNIYAFGSSALTGGKWIPQNFRRFDRSWRMRACGQGKAFGK